MPEVNSSRYYITAGWDDAPHLDEKTKRELEASTPPHLRAARMNGEPSLGAGAVYPISPDAFRISPIPIPDYFRRGYGLDVGWNRTAAVWGAHDVDNDVLYLIGEHYVGQQPAAVHASAIRARGAWQPGFIDPASQGSSQRDGKKLIDDYRAHDLNLKLADNAVEAGIQEVYTRLATGRLKVFSTLVHWFDEYRTYSRDEKTGKVVKKHDHCLHPETKVLTENGPASIKDLVGTNGRVVSIDGELVDYNNCRLTASNQEIVEVCFSDGSTVKCTPDHLFLSTDGWVQAIDLKGRSLYKVSHCVHGEDVCLSMSYRGQSKSSVGRDITFAESISSVLAGVCMSLSGRLRTAWSRLADSTFITLTTIGQTISRAIWSYGLRRNICLNIRPATNAGSRQKPSPPPLNGMGRMKDAHGIASITNNAKPSCTSIQNLPANIAVKNSLHETRERTAFAAILASLVGGFSRESTTSNGLVPFAKKNSAPTNTSRKRLAASHVLISCREIISAGRSDVYCMTVPSTAAFAVESGVVVHNCMDSTRYLAMAVPQMITRPVASMAMPTPAFSPIDERAGY